MKTLTLCVTTSRYQPRYDWLVDSLLLGTLIPEGLKLLAIDLHAETRQESAPWFRIEPPMPNPWQGKHRLTQSNHWAKATALNTALCLCDTEWIAFVDDRSVLSPTFMQAIQEAMERDYAVCGTYEKFTELQVESGKVIGGKLTGQDPRATGKLFPRACPGSHWFGCCNALPLEWALDINGYDESSNGMGYEDTPFGVMLKAQNRPIMFDERMAVIQDRTPEFSQPVVIRTDPGKSPNDKSHALLKLLEGRSTSTNWRNLRDIRKRLQDGRGFEPSEVLRDWYTGQLLSEL